MVSRTPEVAKQKGTLQTEALPFLMLLRPRAKACTFHSGLHLDNAECLQTALLDTAIQSVGSSTAPLASRRLQQGVFSALGGLAKRVSDLVISSAALLVLWPLMLLIAIAVKLESRGPAIYASRRVGKNGVLFVCYKFRTMVPGASRLRRKLLHLNQRRGPFFKIANDPRVTPLGRFLRKYSLDELPQFWNVLQGNMSLVGPRPHPVEDVEQYRPGHERRLEVMPGMTGLWQVTARENPSFETCMQLDVGYIRQWSLLLDFRILLRTIPAVLAGEGQ